MAVIYQSMIQYLCHPSNQIYIYFRYKRGIKGVFIHNKHYNEITFFKHA